MSGPFGRGGGGGRGTIWPKKTIAPLPWRQTDEEKTTQEIYRKFQGILNKLTPQKFQSLAEQALKLEINTEERLRGVIDKLHSQVVRHPQYCLCYANLCKVLSPVKVEWTTEEGVKKNTNFRRVLLIKCQQEFEKDKKDDEDLERMRAAIDAAKTDEEKQQLEVDMNETMTKARRRSLGNIRFIGELFKLKMLSETIMHECIMRLLKSSSDEESLECYVILITVAGKELDHPEAKERMDAYFKRASAIVMRGKIFTRMTFLLKDVLELRERRWVPRPRQVMYVQPKTIDQVHAEVREEKEMEERMIQLHFRKRRSEDMEGRVEEPSGREGDELGDINKLPRLSSSIDSRPPAT